jgi:hypothetical protein
VDLGRRNSSQGFAAIVIQVPTAPQYVCGAADLDWPLRTAIKAEGATACRLRQDLASGKQRRSVRRTSVSFDITGPHTGSVALFPLKAPSAMTAPYARLLVRLFDLPESNDDPIRPFDDFPDVRRSILRHDAS